MIRLPPIIAYHVVFGAYGFWLPNDPRGSWSQYGWASRLRRFGEPQPIRAGYEPTAADEALRAAMKRELRYPAVRFDGEQVSSVARGFADIIARLRMVVYAAAIMPGHVHLVIARKDMYAETMAGYLKRAASRKLRSEGLHPLAEHASADGSLPTPWEESGWKVFLHIADEIEAAVWYVNQNPIDAKLPAQDWSFLTRYDA